MFGKYWVYSVLVVSFDYEKFCFRSLPNVSFWSLNNISYTLKLFVVSFNLVMFIYS